jgi:DMSO/TMAO reductase YedYZ heme-binding membrane subunit
MTNSMWWYLTRASALTAWAFLTLTLVWGTLVSTRLVQRARARRWLLDLHPYLGTIGLAALVLHIVSAVADTQSHLNWIDTVVPFTSGWGRTGIALGVVALWILLSVEVTSLVRRRLARRTWRGIHLTSYVAAWAMAVHAVMTGTDIRYPVVAWGSLILVAVTTAVTLRRALRVGVVPERAAPASGLDRVPSPSPARALRPPVLAQVDGS